MEIGDDEVVRVLVIVSCVFVDSSVPPLPLIYSEWGEGGGITFI